VLAALDAVGEEHAGAIIQTAVKAAIGGDMRAAELILSRVWPAQKGRPVTVDLPPINAPSDLVGALAAIARAVAIGDITPDESRSDCTAL
jgi:hypothetical protein